MKYLWRALFNFRTFNRSLEAIESIFLNGDVLSSHDACVLASSFADLSRCGFIKLQDAEKYHVEVGLDKIQNHLSFSVNLGQNHKIIGMRVKK